MFGNEGNLGHPTQPARVTSRFGVAPAGDLRPPLPRVELCPLGVKWKSHWVTQSSWEDTRPREGAGRERLAGAWHSANGSSPIEVELIFNFPHKSTRLFRCQHKENPRLFRLTIDIRVPGDAGDHLLHQVVKVGEGLVLLQVGIGLVPKGAFFFHQGFPVVNKCVRDFILLQGYFNAIL